jgi:hypothetical protein
MRQPWNDFSRDLRAKFTVDDDERLWQAAIDEVFGDAEFLCHQATSRTLVYARVGSCSHWLSPHNNGSWLPDAHYAWPSGYGANGHSILGLPEFDWSLMWRWNNRELSWTPESEYRGKRPLTFRVAVPARTARHIRAVVHALWTPGPPTVPTEKLVQAYGFMRTNSEWECTSTFGNGSAYEIPVSQAAGAGKL